MTAWDDFKIHGSNPHTMATGEVGDISNLCQYGWYQWCYYQEHMARFPYSQEVLGQVLGPAHGEGNDMAWVLKENGTVVPHQSLCPLQDAEIHSPTEIKKQATFDVLIERRWGTSIQALKENPKPQF